MWNDALNTFSKKYKGLAMNKNHFFPVFDEAWKKCISRRENATFGFRKCGLVPLNPMSVDYDKLVIKVDIPKHPSSISHHKRVGITRAFQLFESCLSERVRNNFAIRYVNDYDIVDETDRSMMFQFYKKCRKLVEDSELGDSNGDPVQDDASSEDNLISVHNHKRGSNEQQSDLPIPDQAEGYSIQICRATSSAASKPLDSINECGESLITHMISENSPYHSSPFEVIAIEGSPESSIPSNITMDSVASNNASVTQINESSTSNAPNFESTESVIDSFEYSPFKKHLVISPKLIIARKDTKVKSRTPNAVSGDAFTKYATQVQADKQRKIIEKEERKRKREEDKRLKASLPKKTRITAKRKLIIEYSMSETETKAFAAANPVWKKCLTGLVD